MIINLPEPDLTKDKIRYLESNFERVNSWVLNCDQKASVLLATIGIIFAVFFSTDKVADKLFIVVPAIKKACENNDCFHFFLWIAFALLIFVTFLLVFCSIFFLLLTLKSSIKFEKYKDAVNGKTPFSFFGSVAGMNYSHYKSVMTQVSDSDIIEELLSQTYINSKICNRKFENFNKGNVLFRVALALLFVIILIFFFI